MKQIKKVVVTGGAGFIGSHLVERLFEQGYLVTIIDDLSTGKIENVKKLLDDGNAVLDESSITDLPLLNKLFKDVDYVFHLAAYPSVPRSIENPLECHRVNVTGTLNVLEAARENGVGKVVCASSSSVYGDTPVLPKKEDMLPSPLSPYAVAKLAGEYYCQVFYKVYKLPTVSLRYFNVYGPRQDPNSHYSTVIPKSIKLVNENRPPIIYGDGEQTRDFTFVNDIVEATLLAAENDAQGVYNIGGGRSTTINKLTKVIIELARSDVKPIYLEPRLGDVSYSLADISRAATFGYQPKYSLETGLEETMLWIIK
ncbi:SDR family oxidoreductase [Chloroflexota bacterium]